jgi:hypothetical protein
LSVLTSKAFGPVALSLRDGIDDLKVLVFTKSLQGPYSKVQTLS